MIVIGIDGSNERDLDFGCVSPCFDDMIPKWGPTGTEVYFTRVIGPFERPGGAVSAVLWAGSLDGSNVHRVSPEGIDPTYEDYVARFLPSGEMVFLRCATRIWSARCSGSISTESSTSSRTGRSMPTSMSVARDDGAHRWTPRVRDLRPRHSGRRHGGGGNRSRVLRHAQGLHRTPRILTPTVLDETDPRANFNPTWSDNGRSITYARVKWGTAEQSEHGRRDRDDDWNGRLSHDLTSSPGFDFRPDWGLSPRTSPDRWGGCCVKALHAASVAFPQGRSAARHCGLTLMSRHARWEYARGNPARMEGLVTVHESAGEQTGALDWNADRRRRMVIISVGVVCGASAVVFTYAALRLWAITPTLTAAHGNPLVVWLSLSACALALAVGLSRLGTRDPVTGLLLASAAAVFVVALWGPATAFSTPTIVISAGLGTASCP